MNKEEMYFTDQIENCTPMTAESIEKLQCKTMTNGTPWKVGDIILYAGAKGPESTSVITFSKEEMIRESAWRMFYPPEEGSVMPIVVM